MVLLIILAILILIETTILTIKSLKAPKSGGNKRKIYVDTSALMDGRILKIAKTGFLGDNLIIPRSAIREMQLLADGKDSEKRFRARHGMDVVSELERVVFCNTEILEDELDHTPVDERLIELAKENRGIILTCDYNLQKVATTEHIDVLNPNELATELKSEFLPGDEFKLKIISAGANPKQGVGYLPEGTMVVVENTANKIGREVDVIFEKYLQTNSGRMMFAKLKNTSKTSSRTTTRTRTSTRAPRTSTPRTNRRQSVSRSRGSRR